MEAKDLRIGNYLYYFDHLFKLEEIRKDISQYQLKGFSVSKNSLPIIYNDIEAFKPIPLTEEWFNKKTPFVKDEKEIYYFHKPHVGDCWFGLIFARNRIAFVVVCNDFVTIIRWFNYVHEFQNIYKEIKGKELEIK